MLRFVIILSLLLSVSAYATEVYRSVDKNGQPVFSTTPPEGKDHKVVDVEVQNDLGSRVEPSDDTKYYRFKPSYPTVAPRRAHTSPYTPREPAKLDMRDLQSKCESYRNSGRNNEYHRKQRDYWCGRLHRGK